MAVVGKARKPQKEAKVLRVLDRAGEESFTFLPIKSGFLNSECGGGGGEELFFRISCLYVVIEKMGWKIGKLPHQFKIDQSVSSHCEAKVIREKDEVGS